MALGLEDVGLKSCIYCGACFRYCVLGVYSELDGMDLKTLVSGVSRIVRNGYRSGKDDHIKELLERCTLQGYCDKVCPAMVKPFLRNSIAKKRIEEGK